MPTRQGRESPETKMTHKLPAVAFTRYSQALRVRFALFTQWFSIVLVQ